MTTTAPTDTDFRRAAALLTHYVGDCAEGVDAVLDDAEQDGALRQLAWCLPAVITSLQDGWDADVVAAVLRSTTAVWAQREATP